MTIVRSRRDLVRFGNLFGDPEEFLDESVRLKFRPQCSGSRLREQIGALTLK